MIQQANPFQFDESLSGKKVELFLDFKAPGVGGGAKDVQKARAFFPLVHKNVHRLRMFYDFTGIKNVVQMRRQMMDWRDDAQKGEDAFYYIYPKGSDNCVGCLMVSNEGKYMELGGWLDSEATGKGYMQDAMKIIEKSLFEKGVEELIRRFYIDNPNREAIYHNIQKAGYQPYSGLKDVDPNVFETYRKTRDMYLKEKNLFTFPKGQGR